MSLSIIKKFSLKKHLSPVYAIEQADEHKIYTGGGDRIIASWDIREQIALHAVAKTGSAIYSIKYIPQKQKLLIGVSEGNLHVIDLDNGKEEHNFTFHEKGIFDIIYSEKLNLFITAGGDGKIGFWSLSDFSIISEQKLCIEKIRSLTFNADESILAAGCGDGSIRFFNTRSLNEFQKINAHDQSVNIIRFHPFKNLLISGGRDAFLKFWDLDNLENIYSIPAHNFAVYSIAFSPDNKFFASASRDKTLKIWDLEDFSFLSRIDAEKYDGHSHSVNKVLWLKDVLISAGDDKTIIGWSIN
jgi:WD40 repeat protein